MEGKKVRQDKCERGLQTGCEGVLQGKCERCVWVSVDERALVVNLSLTRSLTHLMEVPVDSSVVGIIRGH